MPVWENHLDADDDELQRLALEDPLRMYLVINRRSPVGTNSVPVLAARACMAVTQGEWEAADERLLDQWRTASFGKVCLGAKRPIEWRRVIEEVPGLVLRDVTGNETAFASLPIRKSEQPEALAKLNALVDHQGSDPVPEDWKGSRRAVYVVNPDVPMSLGKICAQVSHAAMMLAASSADAPARHRATLDAWQVARWPGVVTRDDREAFRAERDWAVGVRDAGLTEVARGTRTVVAFVE